MRNSKSKANTYVEILEKEIKDEKYINNKLLLCLLILGIGLIIMTILNTGYTDNIDKDIIGEGFCKSNHQTLEKAILITRNHITTNGITIKCKEYNQTFNIEENKEPYWK